MLSSKYFPKLKGLIENFNLHIVIFRFMSICYNQKKNIDYFYQLQYLFVPYFKTLSPGNKIDLERNRNVTVEQAEEYAKSVGAKHVHTSAKLNRGIDELFLSLTKS